VWLAPSKSGASLYAPAPASYRPALGWSISSGEYGLFPTCALRFLKLFEKGALFWRPARTIIGWGFNAKRSLSLFQSRCV